MHRLTSSSLPRFKIVLKPHGQTLPGPCLASVRQPRYLCSNDATKVWHAEERMIAFLGSLQFKFALDQVGAYLTSCVFRGSCLVLCTWK